MSMLRSAACLIIGDEVLNAKIRDTNSHYFAKFCFDAGISLKRICTVPDEEEDIVNEIKHMASRYDFVVTSGGIGSTHDDITYGSIAKAFNLPMTLHQPTVDRMKLYSRTKLETMSQPVYNAQMRMATFPSGKNVDHHFVLDNMWVPIVTIDSKVHILPGVPQLFEGLLNALKPTLLPRIPKEHMLRYFVNTSRSESSIAPYLSELQDAVAQHSIKIGSYPHMGNNHRSVTVSILGPEAAESRLRDIVSQVELEVDGKEISQDQELKFSGH